MKRMLVRWFALIFASSMVFAVHLPIQGQTSLQQQIQAIADVAVAEGVPGISLAVITPDEGLIAVYAGFANQENKTPVTENTLGRIASASKPWLAVAILKLVEDSKITLDDQISQYIGAENTEKIANAQQVTIAQLLTHTSGIPDYYDDSFGTNAPDKIDYTIDEALAYIYGAPAEFAPGTQHDYSNSNSLLLGKVVESVTGESYAKAIRNWVINPLQLKNTHVEVFETVPSKIARGYSDGDKIEGDRVQGAGLPDGGLVSTGSDMALFMRAVFGEKKVLRAESVALMVTPMAEAEESAIGLHIFLEQTPNGLRYAHTGGIDGYSSHEMYYPAVDIAFAYWVNTSQEDHAEVVEVLEEAVIALLFAE